MGAKIGFYTHSNLTLLELIVSEYKEFKIWTLASFKEFPEEYNLKLINFLNNTDNLTDIKNLNSDLIDDLTAIFIGLYLDTKNILKLHNPLMSAWRYEEDKSLIEENGDENLVRLWNVLIEGRSINNSNKSFNTFNLDEDFKVGYWTVEERKLLNKFLKSTFDLKKFNKENIHTGILCAVQILDETENMDNELIITKG